MLDNLSVSGGLLLSNGNPVPSVWSPNVGGAVKPEYLVIHFTGGGEKGAIDRLTDMTAPRVSAHFVVGEKGETTQLVKLDRVAWHAGVSQWKNRSGLNSYSIGIEIANYGDAVEGRPNHYTAYGHPIPDERVLVARHKNGGPMTPWHTYPQEQFETVVRIAQALHAEFGFKDIVGHDDIAPGRKVDPGPAWDMETFKARVFGATTPAPSPAQKPERGAMQLQRKLNALGFGPLEVDGDIGPKTKKAIKAFQKSQGLSVDGVAGDDTWAAIDALFPLNKD